MLSIEDIRRHLEHVTYRDWTLTVQSDEWEGPQVRILANVPDANDPTETVTLGITTWLPPMESFDQLDRFLVWRLARVESHEAREWYRVDGHAPFDPHRQERPAVGGPSV